MKKYHIISAIIVTLILAGCNNTNQPDNSITFGSSLTKGSIVNEPKLIKSIGIYVASNNGTFDFQNKELVKKTGPDNIWTFNSSDKITWPDGNAPYPISFYAYSPSKSSSFSVTNNKGIPTFKFNMTTEVKDQPDFLLSTKTQEARVNMVPLHFDHPLSKISFSVKGNPHKKIISLTIKDILTKADLKYSAKNGYQWGKTSQKKNISISIDKNELLDITPTYNAPDENVNITSSNGYIFVIPQGASEKIVDINVHDSIENKNESYSLNLPLNHKWEIGKGYNYTIQLEKGDVILYTTEYTNRPGSWE